MSQVKNFLTRLTKLLLLNSLIRLINLNGCCALNQHLTFTYCNIHFIKLLNHYLIYTFNLYKNKLIFWPSKCCPWWNSALSPLILTSDVE